MHDGIIGNKRISAILVGVDLHIRPSSDAQVDDSDEHGLLESSEGPLLGENGQEETQSDCLAALTEEEEVEGTR